MRELKDEPLIKNMAEDVTVVFKPSAASAGYRSEDATLIREGAEAACRAKMLLQGTGNTSLVSYYAVLHSRLEDLANRVER